MLSHTILSYFLFGKQINKENSVPEHSYIKNVQASSIFSFLLTLVSFNSCNLFKTSGQKKIILSTIYFLCFYPNLVNKTSAQNNQEKKQTETEVKTLPPNSRLSLRTNAIDWLLIAPNITMEWDISNSIYNRNTASIGIKGNWNTYHKYTSPIVYNFWDLRGEIRHYWRTEKKQVADGKGKSSFKEWMRDDLFSKRKKSPRYWRAYYIGGYVDGGKYSFKFGKEGIQGAFYGVGLSTGFGIPLYGYNNKFIDLEIGSSLGMVATKYEKYTHDRISNCYQYVEDSHKSWHIVPYPIISDLRVGFVFRFASIKDKYKLVDHVKVAERQERTREKLIQKQEKISEKEEREAQKTQEKETRKKKKGEEEKEKKEKKESKKNKNIEEITATESKLDEQDNT